MELQNEYPGITARGAQLVAVGQSDQAVCHTLVEQSSLTYPVLSDASHEVARLFGVWEQMSPNEVTPATFVIAPDRRLLWSYVATSAGDWPSAEAVLAHLP